MWCDAVGRRRGFVLAELAVIVVVLGLFAMIFKVSIRALREKTSQARCIGNLKHLLSGWQAYAKDHDERLPPVHKRIHDTGKSWIDKATWPTLMQKYFDDPRLKETRPEVSNIQLTRGGIFACPNLATTPSGFRPHYGMNHALMKEYGGWETRSQIPRPAETLVFADVQNSYLVGGVWWANQYVAYRHSAGANCAFADGHCQWLPQKALAVSKQGRWQGQAPWQPK